jgi:hypothetical protein
MIDALIMIAFIDPFHVVFPVRGRGLIGSEWLRLKAIVLISCSHKRAGGWPGAFRG